MATNAVIVHRCNDVMNVDVLAKYTSMCIRCTCIKVWGTKCSTCWPQHVGHWLLQSYVVLKEQKIEHGPAGRSLQFPINIHMHTHLHEDMYNTQTQIHTLHQLTESVTGNT